MPATTNHTSDEIAALERRIAGGVMGWKVQSCGPGMERQCWVDDSGEFQDTLNWSPWNDPADALEVLERLAALVKQHDGMSDNFDMLKIERWLGNWYASIGPYNAISPGDHFGPAVCLLAEKVMEESLTDSRNRR